MNSFTIASVTFACVLGGTLLGMLIGRLLPGHHLSGDSKDSVKQGLAMIATLTALVLGLLVSTTKGNYDSQSATVKEVATNVLLLNRILERYGPETKEARELLRRSIEAALLQMWPAANDSLADPGTDHVRVSGDALFDQMLALEPKSEGQRLLKARALEVTIGLTQLRQRLLSQKESSIPTPFLVILGLWLTVLFGCYGLLAPRNSTVLVTLTVCMLSVAAALFLVLEMDRPFDGMIRVPSGPIRAALAQLGG